MSLCGAYMGAVCSKKLFTVYIAYVYETETNIYNWWMNNEIVPNKFLQSIIKINYWEKKKIPCANKLKMIDLKANLYDFTDQITFILVSMIICAYIKYKQFLNTNFSDKSKIKGNN